MELIERVAESAKAAGVFGPVRIEGNRLICEAQASAEPAEYRVDAQADGFYVSLVMEDRWQSESIESDLVHSGDKLEELIDEELAEIGYESPDGSPPAYKHYRSDDMLFTFVSRVPTDGLGDDDASKVVAQWLLGYEACFRQLGDMDDTGEDE